MRILFLTDRFPPERDAASSRVFERAVYWVRWGHEVTVVTCAPNHPDGEVFPGYRNKAYQVETMEGIRVVRVKTYIAQNEGTWRRIVDFLSFMVTGSLAGAIQKRPDVIVASSPQIFTAVAGCGLRHLRGVPYVFELADLWPATIKDMGALRNDRVLGALESLELFLYRQSAAIVSLTRAFEVDLVDRGIDPAKIHVVVNGVELSLFSPRPADTELADSLGLTDCFVVGYMGTTGPAHGLTNVLDAAELLPDHPQVRFLVVGAGAQREMLVAEVERRKLTNVVFCPPVPKSEMPRYWSICDVGLVHLRDLPVFETVIPSKMFEALGMGLPLLMCLPRGEASGIAEEEGVGVWVPPEDPGALARAACSLLDDPAAATELQARTLGAAATYSRERQARDMIAVLSRVAGDPSRP